MLLVLVLTTDDTPSKLLVKVLSAATVVAVLPKRVEIFVLFCITIGRSELTTLLKSAIPMAPAPAAIPLMVLTWVETNELSPINSPVSDDIFVLFATTIGVRTPALPAAIPLIVLT